MLIRFNVTNFLSFDEETEFNMLAAKSLKTHAWHVHPLKKDINVLKASAIYGANGAGKSNLIKAIHLLQQIVEDGAVPRNSSNKKFKLKAENKDLPICFDIEFSVGKIFYNYGITYDSDIVLEEWLYQTGLAKPKEIFTRTYSEKKNRTTIRVTDKYIKTEKDKMLFDLMEENLLRQNELLISKNDNLKITEINAVVEWFEQKLKIVYPQSKSNNFSVHLYTDENLKINSEKLLKTFDTGVNTFSFQEEEFDSFFSKNKLFEEDELNKIKEELDDEQIIEFPPFFNDSIFAIKENNKYRIKHMITNHQIDGRSIPFTLKEESDGTQRLVDFLPLLHDLYSDENVYIVDEIDRSLHPSILHKLISKIMNDETTKGQLIFTTHESSLLNCKIFRTDEIWFAEKDKKTQSSRLYTLNEFKPRADLDFEKGYLNGRFGAIPFLANLEDLNWNE